jgi:hypothetical protein
MNTRVLAMTGTFVISMGLGVANAATTNERLTQHITDPTSGVDIRVSQDRSGDVSVSLGDGTVSIRKRMAQARSVTTIESGSERVTLDIDLKGLALSGSRGSAKASWAQPESLAGVQRVLFGSAAMEKAIALLRRINLGPRSPLGHVLVTTSSVLSTAVGDLNAKSALSQWIRTTARSLNATSVSMTAASNASKCWDEYARDAVEAYDDFVDCVESCAWYNFVGKNACMFIYELREVGIFSTYLRCVGIGS